eukprot:scaffold44890_cov21-Prasinocladus_malaysianus.AAC.1
MFATYSSLADGTEVGDNKIRFKKYGRRWPRNSRCLCTSSHCPYSHFTNMMRALVASANRRRILSSYGTRTRTTRTSKDSDGWRGSSPPTDADLERVGASSSKGFIFRYEQLRAHVK